MSTQDKKVIVNKSSLTNIANALRNKFGKPNATYKPYQMANEINQLTYTKVDNQIPTTPMNLISTNTPSLNLFAINSTTSDELAKNEQKFLVLDENSYLLYDLNGINYYYQGIKKHTVPYPTSDKITINFLSQINFCKDIKNNLIYYICSNKGFIRDDLDEAYDSRIEYLSIYQLNIGIHDIELQNVLLDFKISNITGDNGFYHRNSQMYIQDKTLYIPGNHVTGNRTNTFKLYKIPFSTSQPIIPLCIQTGGNTNGTTWDCSRIFCYMNYIFWFTNSGKHKLTMGNAMYIYDILNDTSMPCLASTSNSHITFNYMWNNSYDTELEKNIEVGATPIMCVFTNDQDTSRKFDLGYIYLTKNENDVWYYSYSSTNSTDCWSKQTTNITVTTTFNNVPFFVCNNYVYNQAYQIATCYKEYWIFGKAQDSQGVLKKINILQQLFQNFYDLLLTAQKEGIINELNIYSIVPIGKNKYRTYCYIKYLPSGGGQHKYIYFNNEFYAPMNLPTYSLHPIPITQYYGIKETV